MPRVIQAIESEITRGRGETFDPVRRVICYHSLEGELLAERDEWRLSHAGLTALVTAAKEAAVADKDFEIGARLRDIETELLAR